MTARPSSPRDAGFTLVEALVSLFVFALISAGAVALLIQGVRGQETLNRVDAELRDIQITQALLSADAAQIVARPTRQIDNTFIPAITGGDGALSLVRAIADQEAATGAGARLQFVEYVVRDGALIRRARETLDAMPDAPLTERVVMRDIAAARFAFFNGRDWVASWRPVAAGAFALASPAPRAIALEVDHRTRGTLRIAARVGAQG